MIELRRFKGEGKLAGYEIVIYEDTTQLMDVEGTLRLLGLNPSEVAWGVRNVCKQPARPETAPKPRSRPKDSSSRTKREDNQ